MTTTQKLKYCAQLALIQYQDKNGNYYDMEDCDITYSGSVYQFRITFWNTQGILHEIQFAFTMTNVMKKTVEELRDIILTYMKCQMPYKPR